jgi:hypothetical protein
MVACRVRQGHAAAPAYFGSQHNLSLAPNTPRHACPCFTQTCELLRLLTRLAGTCSAPWSWKQPIAFAPPELLLPIRPADRMFDTLLPPARKIVLRATTAASRSRARTILARDTQPQSASWPRQVTGRKQQTMRCFLTKRCKAQGTQVLMLRDLDRWARWYSRFTCVRLPPHGRHGCATKHSGSTPSGSHGSP